MPSTSRVFGVSLIVEAEIDQGKDALVEAPHLVSLTGRETNLNMVVAFGTQLRLRVVFNAITTALACWEHSFAFCQVNRPSLSLTVAFGTPLHLGFKLVLSMPLSQLFYQPYRCIARQCSACESDDAFSITISARIGPQRHDNRVCIRSLLRRAYIWISTFSHDRSVRITFAAACIYRGPPL